MHTMLEPHFDARTMEIHHSKHHNAYVTNLNAALEGTGLEDKSLCELLADWRPSRPKSAAPCATTVAAMPTTVSSGRSSAQMAAVHLLAIWPLQSMPSSVASTRSRLRFRQGRRDPLWLRLGLVGGTSRRQSRGDLHSESGQHLYDRRGRGRRQAGHWPRRREHAYYLKYQNLARSTSKPSGTWSTGMPPRPTTKPPRPRPAQDTRTFHPNRPYPGGFLCCRAACG